MKEHDTLRRFMFEQANIRGAIVHLDATWRAVLQHKVYPDAVREQLGRCMAAAALLSSTIKYDGSMIMQIQSAGPITMLVVEASGEKTLRGTVKYRDQPSGSTLPELFGKGTLMFTVDTQNAKDRYQGIVALEGDTLSQTLEAYFYRSEQLETQFWLAADANGAAGFLIQKMPGGIDVDQDAWNRAQALAATVTDTELLSLSAEELIRRLFAEEDIRLYDGEPVCFRCSCSREKVAGVLRGLGIDQVQEILADEGVVTVTCEYCNQPYVFDKVDAQELFAAATHVDVPKTRH